MALLMVLPGWGSILPVFFFPLACLEILPAYFRAARQKFRGAWTLFFSVLLCLLFLLILVQVNMESVAVLTALVLVTPALGVMIFIAGDFARTSSALQQQIVEVEALSEKNLAHEREKQDILAVQKEELEREVEVRTAALRQSLADLKAAQAKLVQAEKMASLGELTAGVAHEIQNPLNFINNFSELSIELSGELHDEVANAQLPVEQKRLLQDTAIELVKNQEKILHHGRRADAIVKNMLQHSRKSAGTKEPTNINDLVEQYLQLSFHGLRARDKEFNTALQKDYDESIIDIPVVPQDIGRVLLNLFNNAFYAVREKKKKLNGTFEPAVSVQTKKAGNKVFITISDNGMGIPTSIADKIFQPFFTTKPAGEGTGLGLSLSYDIITKGHGGQLTVTSTEGEGSSFMILLPLV
jgi:signal transduction histidine kinase